MDLKIRDLFSKNPDGSYEYKGQHEINLGELIRPGQSVDLLRLELLSEYKDNATLHLDFVNGVFYIRGSSHPV